MKSTVNLSAILLLAHTHNALGEAPTLRLTTSIPDVEINERVEQRALVQLPSLQYQFDVDRTCDADSKARSVMISVADTRVRVDVESLTGPNNSQLTLSIPAQQIAPIVLENFCWAEAETIESQEALVIRGAFSAQAALLCSDGTTEKTIYASKSLDVLLRCVRKGEPVISR